MLLSFKDIIISADNVNEIASVGKLRSSAELAFSQGEIEKAIQLWEKVISLEPRNEQNYYKRYRVYLRKQRLREALSDLNSALEIKPNDENFLSNRGKLNIKLGRCSNAALDFNDLARLYPNNKDLSLRPNAIACASAMKEAENAFKHNKYSLAKDFYNQALRFAESSSFLFIQRAYCWSFLNEHFEAISDTGKAIKIDSNSIEALELRGKSYYIIGEYESAKTHFRHGLKFDPEHDGCKNGFRLIKKIQDLQKKIKKYNDANDFTETIKQLLKLSTIDQKNNLLIKTTFIQLSEAYRKSKQFDEAKQTIEKSLQLDEVNTEAHVELGRVNMELENYEEAIRNFKRANEINQATELSKDINIEELLKKAEAALKQSKQKDYYKILEIKRTSTLKQI